MIDEKELNDEELAKVAGGKTYTEYSGYHVGEYHKSVNFDTDRQVAYITDIRTAHMKLGTHIFVFYDAYTVDENNHGILTRTGASANMSNFPRFYTKDYITVVVS